MNISIDDDLYARVKALGRGINSSEVCARALKAAVRTNEKKQEAKVELSNAIARLRAQRAETEDENKQHGYGAGWSWARDTASYQELRDFVSLLEEARGRYSPPPLPESAWDYAHDQEGEEAAWRRGWDEAVLEFWGEVSEALQ